MKVHDECLLPNGRVDLRVLKGAEPGLFRSFSQRANSVRIGQRDYSELNPYNAAAAKATLAKAAKLKDKNRRGSDDTGSRKSRESTESRASSSGNKSKKTVKKKTPVVSSDSSGSDSELEEMKKKMSLKMKAVTPIMPGMAAASNKPPPQRPIKPPRSRSGSPVAAGKSRKRSGGSRRSSPSPQRKSRKDSPKPRIAKRKLSSSPDSRRSSLSSSFSRSRSRSFSGSPVRRSSPISSSRSRSRSRSSSRSRSRSKSPVSKLGSSENMKKEKEAESKVKANPLFDLLTAQDSNPNPPAKTEGTDPVPSTGEESSKDTSSKEETSLTTKTDIGGGKDDIGDQKDEKNDVNREHQATNIPGDRQEEAKNKAEDKVSSSKEEKESKVPTTSDAAGKDEEATVKPKPLDKEGLDRKAVEASLLRDFGGIEKEKIPPVKEQQQQPPLAKGTAASSSSEPKLDLKLLTLSKDLRYFRDILCFELGPNPKFLRPGHEPTMAQFERIVRTVVDNYERPAKDKPAFVPAKSLPAELSDADKALLKEHGVDRTCNLTVKDVSDIEKYKSLYKLAYGGLFNGKKAMTRRRKERLMKGLKMLKDDASGKRIVDQLKKKNRPILDSDSEDGGVKDPRKMGHHKKHKKDKDKHKERSNSTEKKVSFT
jgi:hypothetical protein